MRRLALLAMLAPTAALAHATSISYSELSVDGSTVRGELRFSLPDLQTQGPVDPARLDPAALRRLAVEPFVVSQDGKPCALGEGVVARMDGPDGVTLQASWTCPAPVRRFSVRVAFLDSFPLGHTHLSRVVLGPGEVAQRVAQADQPGFEVTATGGGGGSSGSPRFLLLGIEHVLLGPEHLAFLLLLVLLGGPLTEQARVVTAFTLAHSISLLVAALAPMALPARALDLMLGGLVLVAAAENFTTRATEPALRRRWALAAVLGLVHGLGFSGVLPRGSLASGMLPFSLGLESAQLAVVAAALPLLARLRRNRWLGRAGAAAAAVLAAAWLVLRLRG